MQPSLSATVFEPLYPPFLRSGRRSPRRKRDARACARPLNVTRSQRRKGVGGTSWQGTEERERPFFVRDEKKEQRSERAHCGYGVFIHWYRVTRFRPLEPAPVSGPDSLPIKMPPPSFSLSPLERRRRRRGEDRLREKEREKRKKKEEKIKNRPVYLFADTGVYLPDLCPTPFRLSSLCPRDLLPPDIETYRLRIDFTRSGRCWTACE